MKKTVTKEDMLSSLASLCARSEQCEADLMRKMRLKGMATDDAEWVMARLRNGRFVDNARYASAFARDKVRFSGWGRHKIRAALAARRISGGIAAGALAAVDLEEYAAAADRAARGKAASLDTATREGRVKLYRHLLSRGFESEVAVNAVKRILSYKSTES